MAHLTALRREELVEFEESFALIESVIGFVPNSMKTMARVPGLVGALSALVRAVLSNPLVDPQLSQMVAVVASTAAGCRYCQAHTGHRAELLGVSEAKLSEIWSFETSEHFDDAERAALRLAAAGASVPNGVTAELVDSARAHYTDDQVAAIVSVVALFGFLNRWNDSMATELETPAAAFAERVLGRSGWEVGKHG